MTKMLETGLFGIAIALLNSLYHDVTRKFLLASLLSSCMALKVFRIELYISSIEGGPHYLPTTAASLDLKALYALASASSRGCVL